MANSRQPLHRYQRAYMDYFSRQHGLAKGNSQQLSMSELLSPEPKPLLLGLFGGFGQPLLLLSDAIELRSAILVVESLVLAAVDWDSELSDILQHPQLAATERAAGEQGLAPETIVARIAYDGRFSGIMTSGPGIEHVPLVLSNSAARTAVIDYVGQLDLADQAELLDRLSDLSVTMACGTHKRGQPAAFDYYLNVLPGLVQGLRVLLPRFDDDKGHQVVLIRGVWLLMILAYVTQLRPVIDPSLISGFDVAPGESNWDSVFSEFRAGGGETTNEKYLDAQLLRSLRSLYELGRASSGAKEGFYIQAAWKLRSQWHHWIGFGTSKEETLNIRL